MAISNIKKESILKALEHIDKNGCPDKMRNNQYELIDNNSNKKYSPLYVIALANQIQNNVKISTDSYNIDDVNQYLKSLGYTIKKKQEKYELIITANDIISTDNRFTINDLSLGGNYQPLDTYFISNENKIIKRKRNKSENRISNQTLPRLAFQIYEKQIINLSDLDKKEFPVCKYTSNDDFIRGIFSNEEEFRKYRNSMEYLVYWRENGPKYLIYSWNIFSTLFFVQECLKRFGNQGDQFILIYKDKPEKEITHIIDNSSKECKNPYSKFLLKSKNVIFRGAPGTGKSYLAKQIAADIVSNGYTDQYIDLTSEQKSQIAFVQFHPSYDYSDFVEGLRPKMNDAGNIGFELQDGIFKSFVEKAKRNFENSQKSIELRKKEISAEQILTNFFENLEYENNEFQTVNGNNFSIINVDDKNIYISIPNNKTSNQLSLSIDEIRKLLESGLKFEKVSDITHFFGKKFSTQANSYTFALFKEMKKLSFKDIKDYVNEEDIKKYIFIIDEINRGEISKIFGELFFSIDPGYRGKAGEVATQYSNMHTNPDEKFYIPENVYIIGTMNDIDRSVDNFDFAMRRRFRFVEIKAEDTQNMLESLDNENLKNEAVSRMDKLNAEIIKVDDLNENYQIGASYFLKLKNISFDELWTDYLNPLLKDYVRGLYDEEGIMKRFARAYGYEGYIDETIDN